MKKLAKITLLALAILLVASTEISAQTLTENQKELLRERVKSKVEEFQYSLSRIVNNQMSHQVRKEHVKLLFNLFLGEGEPYDYYDSSLRRNIHSEGVRMETASINRYGVATKKTQKLKTYIYKLYNPVTGKSSMKYDKLVIDAADAVRVDNIQLVGDHYECVAHIFQRFVGFSGDGRKIYGDDTGKKIRCYIKALKGIGSDVVWDVKLGDIYVTSITRLK